MRSVGSATALAILMWLVPSAAAAAPAVVAGSGVYRIGPTAGLATDVEPRASLPRQPALPPTDAARPAVDDEPPPDNTFVLPVPAPAVVLVPFRPPAQRYGTGHRGVDLGAPVGTSIRAAASGTVIYAGVLAGRGVVSVQHTGGLRTTYEPVDAVVGAGQAVTAGQELGTLQAGHPPCAPADCLHWGVRLPDGTYLDPMTLLRQWRVRLKPWDPG